MSSILNIALEAADICAVQRPTDLFSNTSQNDILFASVVKSTLASLMRHADWQCLICEGVLHTRAGQTDYVIEEVVPDFYSLVGESIYIEDSSKRVIGSISEECWAREKQFHCPEIDVLFKIQNNMIRFVKDPGEIFVRFAYKSKAVCVDVSTGKPKSQITANSDVPVFDEYLVKLGIIWRFQKRSGLDYTEEYNEYIRELNKSYAQTKAAADICLGVTNDVFGSANGGVVIDASQTVK